jgi:hypothetical protein
MAEAPSVTSFVMENRLPWPEEMGAAALGGPYDHGLIYDDGQVRQCSIRSISALGATVCDVAKMQADEIALELATGQRPAGTIEWVRGGEAGIRFKQPIDMLALINRKLVSQPAERRSMPRIELRCGLYVKWCTNLEPATLRNISALGLQIEGDGLPPTGTLVGLFVEGLNVPPGEIVWRKDNLAGVELFEELSWTSIIPWIREVGKKAATSPIPR